MADRRLAVLGIAAAVALVLLGACGRGGPREQQAGCGFAMDEKGGESAGERMRRLREAGLRASRASLAGRDDDEAVTATVTFAGPVEVEHANAVAAEHGIEPTRLMAGFPGRQTFNGYELPVTDPQTSARYTDEELRARFDADLAVVAVPEGEAEPFAEARRLGPRIYALTGDTVAADARRLAARDDVDAVAATSRGCRPAPQVVSLDEVEVYSRAGDGPPPVSELPDAPSER